MLTIIADEIIKYAKFLACAIASDADYLITGDRDFSESTTTSS